VIIGGAFPYGARRAIAIGDGWMPHISRPQYDDVTEFLPKFQEMAKEAGREPGSVPVTAWAVGEDADRLKRYRDLGIERAVVSLPSEKADTTLPLLDRWADLIRTVQG
jgi:alkanesulfonate monooxygenase SsuD/methylene tetrahydromethanopterin reductase-like flavin-dependent oxidoreductase (luciferase family)